MKEKRDYKLLKGMGYRYEKIDNDTNEKLTFYEFHVDDDPHFQIMTLCCHFGGYPSVHFPSGPNGEQLKPLIILGQDECVFK